jgi:hypothetical protein
MGFFDWLTGKKNAPAANIRPAANMTMAMPTVPTAAPAQFGGRKRTRKARKGRRVSRKNRKGAC